MKRFERLVAAQDQAEWWAKQKTEPAAYKYTMKSYSKHCQQNNRRGKFNLLTHRKILKKKHGTRRAGRYKKMWKEEFVEKMQETQHGSYTKKEALRMWDGMENSTRKRDNKGPMGHCAIQSAYRRL